MPSRLQGNGGIILEEDPERHDVAVWALEAFGIKCRVIDDPADLLDEHALFAAKIILIGSVRGVRNIKRLKQLSSGMKVIAAIGASGSVPACADAVVRYQYGAIHLFEALYGLAPIHPPISAATCATCAICPQ